MPKNCSFHLKKWPIFAATGRRVSKVLQNCSNTSILLSYMLLWFGFQSFIQKNVKNLRLQFVKTEVQANSFYKTLFFSTHKTPVRPYFKKEKLSKKLVVLKNTCFAEFWELFTLFFIYFFILLEFLGSISGFRFRPFFFFKIAG